MNTLSQYLTQIQQDGLAINTVYDIGANNGQWSLALKHGVLKDSYFYLFEGSSEHDQALKNTNLPYYIGILSNPGRTLVEYYQAGSSTGNSYYKENTVHYENAVPELLPAQTLDSIVEECGMPVPNFIKIDTQGSELDILQGAEKILSSVDLVMLECPIIRYNKGAPDIQDYIDYMRTQGFMPSEIMEIHEGQRILSQIDIMFINAKTRDKICGPLIGLTDY